MNFLIFDKEHVSTNLVDTILADFRHVTFITSQDALLSIPSSSPTFLLIKQVEINHAHQVLQSLSKHENDPFDAVIMCNAVTYSNFQNVLETLKRIKPHPPPLFLFFVGQKYEEDKTFIKALRDCSQILKWTIVVCNEICSSSSKTYTVEKQPNPNKTQQAVSSAGILEFLCEEMKSRKYANKTIYVY